MATEQKRMGRGALGMAALLLTGAVAVSAGGCRQVLGVEDPVPCSSDDACNQASEPCVTGECVDGACEYTFREVGFVVDKGAAGDCKASVCNANGEAAEGSDPTDAPEDSTPGDCQSPACGDDGSVTMIDDLTDTPDADIPGDCRKPTCQAARSRRHRYPHDLL